MNKILNFIKMMGVVAIFLSGCATVQEKKAVSDWHTEHLKFGGYGAEEFPLPELESNATLDDYLLYAFLNNPGLRAAFDRWKAALEKMAAVRTLPDPRFTYANYIKEVETRVGAQEQKFGLAQTFPWFGKLDLRGKMALQAAHAERQRYEAAKLNLIYRIKKTCYEYEYIAQAVDIAKDNVTLLTYLESVARATYRGGTGLQSAVIQTQIELGKLEDRLHSLQDSMRPITVKLNIALNRPPYMALPVPKGLSQEIPAVSDQGLKSTLRSKNPNLRIFDFLAAKEKLASRLAAKNHFPDMTLGVDYIDTASRSDIYPEDNGKDPVIAKLSVNLPVWQAKYDALKRSANARHRAVMQERREKENLLIADLELALYHLRDADRRIDLYQNTLIPKAEQNMKVTQQAFTSNRVSFLDLIDSQRTLLGFQLEHTRALADSAQRMAEIEMLVGGKIDVKDNGIAENTTDH